jgi:hypothetical protein
MGASECDFSTRLLKRFLHRVKAGKAVSANTFSPNRLKLAKPYAAVRHALRIVALMEFSARLPHESAHAGERLMAAAHE